MKQQRCTPINGLLPLPDGGGQSRKGGIHGIRTKRDQDALRARRHTRGGRGPRKSYASYASFGDPDGNGRVMQEITVRLDPGLKPTDTWFSPQLLKAALAMGEEK